MCCPRAKEVPYLRSTILTPQPLQMNSSDCSRKEQAGASRGAPSVVLDCILSNDGNFSTVYGGTFHTGESVAVKTFVGLNG